MRVQPLSGKGEPCGTYERWYPAAAHVTLDTHRASECSRTRIVQASRHAEWACRVPHAADLVAVAHVADGHDAGSSHAGQLAACGGLRAAAPALSPPSARVGAAPPAKRRMAARGRPPRATTSETRKKEHVTTPGVTAATWLAESTAAGARCARRSWSSPKLLARGVPPP